MPNYVIYFFYEQYETIERFEAAKRYNYIFILDSAFLQV